MKITDIKATILRTNSVFAPTRGIGECSPMNHRVLAGFVETALKPLLIGEDPPSKPEIYALGNTR